MRKPVRPVIGPVVVAACAGLVLSGCSLAGASLPRPAEAAVVGDDTIGLDAVDDDTDTVCTALGDVGASAVSRAGVEAVAVQYGVLRAIGDQIAAEYDVEAGAAYDSVVAQYEQQFAAADDVDGVVRVISGPDYLVGVSVAASGGSLDDPGLDQETAQGLVADGLALARAWVDENGLSVNPRFASVDLTSLETVYQPSSTVDELSVPVSAEATDAAAERSSALDGSADAASLPDDERCGG